MNKVSKQSQTQEAFGSSLLSLSCFLCPVKDAILKCDAVSGQHLIGRTMRVHPQIEHTNGKQDKWYREDLYRNQGPLEKGLLR
jgi:hypothetical protein